MKGTAQPQDCQRRYWREKLIRDVFTAEQPPAEPVRFTRCEYTPPGEKSAPQSTEYDVEAAMAEILGPDYHTEPTQEAPAPQATGWKGEWFDGVAEEPEVAPETEAEDLLRLMSPHLPPAVPEPTPEPKEAATEPPIVAPTEESAANPAPALRQPKMQMVSIELMQSDAFRTLSRSAVDVLMFVLSRRTYPAQGRDYHHPLNENEIHLPYATIKDFFGHGRKRPPTDKTISQAIHELMAAGFIAQLKQGGSGKGDTSLFRLAQEWRTWREGDGPVFTKAPRRKGYTNPSLSKWKVKGK